MAQNQSLDSIEKNVETWLSTIQFHEDHTPSSIPILQPTLDQDSSDNSNNNNDNDSDRDEDDDELTNNNSSFPFPVHENRPDLCESTIANMIERMISDGTQFSCAQYFSYYVSNRFIKVPMIRRVVSTYGMIISHFGS